MGFFETSHGATMNPFRDDEALIAVLAKHGVHAQRIPWDEKGVDWKTFDKVIVRTTWDYFTRCAEFLTTIQKIGRETELWNSAKTITWNANKKYLIEMEKQGVPVVPTALVEKATPERVAEVANGRGWKEFVAKPTESGGALSTFLFPRDFARRAEINEAHSKEFIVQPFIPSVGTEGEWAFHFFRGQYEYSILKTAAKGDFRVQSIHGAWERQETADPKDVAVAKKVLDSLDEPTLYARVDMVRDASGKLLLMELELIEPHLYFGKVEGAVEKFADAILDKR